MSETISIKKSSPVIPKKTFTLPQKVFKSKINTQAIFDSIMSERASVRQGTHKVKTRAEVRGGGRKPHPQKGTGNARQGSIRSPQFVGGGIVGGPTPNKNYALKVNKKVKRLAYNSSLTLKAKENAIIVHDFKIEKIPNTKAMIKQIEVLKLKKSFKKILIVTNDFNVKKSVANLQKVFVTSLKSLRIETIVNVDVIIFSSEAMQKLGGNE